MAQCLRRAEGLLKLLLIKSLVLLFIAIGFVWGVQPTEMVCSEIKTHVLKDFFEFPKVAKFSGVAISENNVSELVQSELKKDGISFQRIAFLSFDDGPSSYTPYVLDILDAYDVPAIFFLWGNRILANLPYNQLLLQRMKNDGHHLALHSMNHDFYDLYIGANASYRFLKQMQEVQSLIYDLTGFYSNLCRAPFGMVDTFSPEHHHAIYHSQFKCIDWNIDPEDWRNLTGQAIFDQLVFQVTSLHYPSEVMILLHDVYSRTVDALPLIIEWLLENGYEIRPYDLDHEFTFQNYRL